ncbi:hypothetical protein JIY74_26190 [Vibrio harveyi]|nr:hypothetical protein [Vibrio harveyi]
MINIAVENPNIDLLVLAPYSATPNTNVRVDSVNRTIADAIAVAINHLLFACFLDHKPRLIGPTNTADKNATCHPNINLLKRPPALLSPLKIGIVKLVKKTAIHNHPPYSRTHAYVCFFLMYDPRIPNPFTFTLGSFSLMSNCIPIKINNNKGIMFNAANRVTINFHCSLTASEFVTTSTGTIEIIVPNG